MGTGAFVVVVTHLRAALCQETDVSLTSPVSSSQLEYSALDKRDSAVDEGKLFSLAFLSNPSPLSQPKGFRESFR